MHTIFPATRSTENPDNPLPLYRSPRYTSLTFAPVLSGTDLCARRDPDGSVSLWLVHWTLVEGETGITTQVSEEFAVWFIRELFFEVPFVMGLEHANIMEYLPGLYWAAERKAGDAGDGAKEGTGENAGDGAGAGAAPGTGKGACTDSRENTGGHTGEDADE